MRTVALTRQVIVCVVVTIAVDVTFWTHWYITAGSLIFAALLPFFLVAYLDVREEKRKERESASEWRRLARVAR